MKFDWKTLLYALISSITATEISSIIFAITEIIQVYPMCFDHLLQFFLKIYRDIMIDIII